MRIDKSNLYVKKEDLDAFLKARTYQGKYYHMTNREEGFNNAILEVRSFVKTANCVEAAPVKHGTWRKFMVTYKPDLVPATNETLIGRQCSICHLWAISIKGHVDYKFCPHCGARMDGGGSDG